MPTIVRAPGNPGAQRGDMDYATALSLTYGPFDYNVGAVRMSVGGQRTWTIRTGYAVMVPQMEILPGATLVVGDGAILQLI